MLLGAIQRVGKSFDVSLLSYDSFFVVLRSRGLQFRVSWDGCGPAKSWVMCYVDKSPHKDRNMRMRSVFIYMRSIHGHLRSSL